MKRILSLAFLVALFGIAFAGTIVNVGETTPAGGTTTTTTTTTATGETSTEETEGSSGGLGGLTMENADGDTINVGGSEGAITPLGSGEGTSGTSESGSTTFPNGGTGSPSSSSTNSGTSPVETSCTLGFALLACAIAAFTSRK